MSFNNKFVLVISSDKALLQSAEIALKKVDASVSISHCSFDEIARQPNHLSPLFILVDFLTDSNNFSGKIKDIQSRFVATRIVGAGHPSGVQELLEFIKLGVKDFVNVPFRDEEITALFTPAAASAADKPSKSAKVISLYSPKGGSGVTFLTANLAIALIKTGSRVAICDLSQECGDVCTLLNLTPMYTLRDVLDNNQLLDNSFLDGVMLTHSSGVKILAAPREDQTPPTVENVNSLKNIFSLIKSTHDFLLLDAGHLNPFLLHFIWSESDQSILLGNPDVASLKGLVNLVRKMTALHYDPDKIKVVINRYNSKSQVDSREFEKMARHPISFYLPNNYQLCILAVNSGQPLNDINDKSDLAKKIMELADNIRTSVGASQAENAVRPMLAKKGLFRCF